MVDKRHVFWLIDYIKDNKPAKFIEVGVAKGGILAIVSKYSPDTLIYGLDSWEEMPDITDEDDIVHKKYNKVKWSNMDDVYNSFKLIEASTNNLKLIKGYLEETIPKNKDELNNIDVLRLDVDWYNATSFCLINLYNNVKPGGLIIIDDYHWNVGCKLATDNFLNTLVNKPKLYRHYEKDFGPIYFFKEL
jgi:SAM-dependent methyltransferase